MSKSKKSKTSKKTRSKTARSNAKTPKFKVIEGMQAKLFEKEDEVVSTLEQAQDIMYEAWETDDPSERMELALDALEISPACADAYVLLAEEFAVSVKESLEFYRLGVAAGEFTLGKEIFEEEAGNFWGILETRPYMRARAGLADCLWETGNHEEAVKHYKDLLRLNPIDNQGVRYELIPRLIEMGIDNEAEELYQQYEEDAGACWHYSRVLLDFRKSGDSVAATAALKKAVKNNKYVSDLLTGRHRLPLALPAFYKPGDDVEAAYYAFDNLPAWIKTRGALEWLASKSK